MNVRTAGILSQRPLGARRSRAVIPLAPEPAASGPVRFTKGQHRHAIGGDMNERPSPETGLTLEQLENRYGAAPTIDPLDDLQIGYWADRLDVTEHQLHGAIALAGPRIEAIALALGVEDPRPRKPSAPPGTVPS
jgi:hypothetical protein